MNEQTHSDDLWRKIGLAEGLLWAAGESFWMHGELSGMLPAFLTQLHSIMRASVPLMTAARERALRLAQDDDPCAAIAARYLQHHIGEEADHEEWLLNDLEALGLRRQSVLETVPGGSVAALVGAQYFWINHAHPVAIFGYLAVLEGYPPLTAQLAEIQRRTGAPPEAFRCLIAHAEDDPEHLAEINRTLDEMPLTPQQSKLIALSAFQTIDGVADIFAGLTGKLAARMQHA